MAGIYYHQSKRAPFGALQGSSFYRGSITETRGTDQITTYSKGHLRVLHRTHQLLHQASLHSAKMEKHSEYDDIQGSREHQDTQIESNTFIRSWYGITVGSKVGEKHEESRTRKHSSPGTIWRISRKRLYCCNFLWITTVWIRATHQISILELW